MLALLVSFASLVPGGPIENRDFSGIGSSAFNGFNVFLISLGVSGFVAAYFVWRGSRRVYWATILISWLYIVVVALDLGKVFPVSPDQTGFLLGLIMIIDAILALNVVLFSHKTLGHL
ncbi:MAG: hypothetical protein K8I60_01360 [Anaerolineae bacterium]|nr:hypothetical protein [Anaerolineae bacterium]